jgi:heparosan-N-sulfate-glucuronate 5-epimerase
MRYSTVKNFLNKSLVFFKEDSANYWHTITKCQISEKPDKIGKYYLDFSSKVNYPSSFTGNGIPLYSHFGQSPIIHPIVVCQYAFGLFELFARSGSESIEYRDKFLIQANWLVENSVDWKSSGKVWNINYDIVEYGLVSPWISGLAQGEAISILTRAYKITSDKSYISLAEKALVPFEFSVEDSGLVNKFNGNIIYEEYPSPLKTVGVLNGFIFSLFGLHDLSLVNNSSKSQTFFNDGVNSLIKLLNYFDINYWTNYYLFDFPKNYCSSFTYHRLVTEQLKAMHIITGNEIFNSYYNQWNTYSNKLLNKFRALGSKLFYNHKLKS